MNTLKFQPIREKRQECFNVEDYSFNDFDFEGKQRRVYSNVNLSIFTDDYCNANCKFCVAQLRFENRSQIYSKTRIQSDEEYFNRLDEVLNKLKPLNPSISITGGEPTKSKRLVPILRLIEKYGYRKRTLTTNGSGLFDIVEGKPIIQHITDNHFQHLNISKTHYDEDINRSIMQYDAGTGYTSNEDIAKIAAFAKANNLRPRLSCLLLKSGIHDIDGIIKYLNYYQQLGIDNVIFRETMDYDQDSMLNKPKMEYLKENKVKLNDIWKNIDNDFRFTPIRQLLGYYYYVEVYKYQNIDMVSESANLVKLYEQKQKAEDVVFEMIFHPNGNLNGSWVDNEDILLEYKKPEIII
jgi:molybdenum cofactor biosynthesis enzyme MoaA